MDLNSCSMGELVRLKELALVFRYKMDDPEIRKEEMIQAIEYYLNKIEDQMVILIDNEFNN